MGGEYTLSSCAGSVGKLLGAADTSASDSILNGHGGVVHCYAKKLRLNGYADGGLDGAYIGLLGLAQAVDAFSF